jgi:hypothetical protein
MLGWRLASTGREVHDRLIVAVFGIGVGVTSVCDFETEEATALFGFRGIEARVGSSESKQTDRCVELVCLRI